VQHGRAQGGEEEDEEEEEEPQPKFSDEATADVRVNLVIPEREPQGQAQAGTHRQGQASQAGAGSGSCGQVHASLTLHLETLREQERVLPEALPRPSRAARGAARLEAPRQEAGGQGSGYPSGQRLQRPPGYTGASLPSGGTPSTRCSPAVVAASAAPRLAAKGEPSRAAAAVAAAAAVQAPAAARLRRGPCWQ